MGMDSGPENTLNLTAWALDDYQGFSEKIFVTVSAKYKNGLRKPRYI